MPCILDSLGITPCTTAKSWVSPSWRKCGRPIHWWGSAAALLTAEMGWDVGRTASRHSVGMLGVVQGETVHIEMICHVAELIPKKSFWSVLDKIFIRGSWQLTQMTGDYEIGISAGFKCKSFPRLNFFECR